MYLTSSATSRKLIGTRMRPEPDTPNRAVSRRAELWLTIATRSPTPMPERVEPGGHRPGPLGHLAVGDRAPRLGRLVGLVDDAVAVGVEQLGAAEEVVDGQRNLHGANAIRSASTRGERERPRPVALDDEGERRAAAAR